jgi:signal transduction histidine kinase
MHDDGKDKELIDLRARLAEAEETLRAIREGEVDALLIADQSGDRLYTLRSADAPYRALVEQMQEGAVTLTTAGDVIYCNRRFAELVHTPLQDVIGGGFFRFIVSARDRETLKSLLAYGAGKLRTFLQRWAAPAIETHISVSAMTVDGEEYRTLIVSDVTSLMKAQRENRSKDEFLAMLAHELRNPLAAVGSAADVLKMSELPTPAAVHARNIIERQVSHMARLIDDLLDVGRAITGKIALDRRPMDLAECVKTCVSGLTAARPGARRVEVSAEPVWVLADAVRLEQIACNLISNALKFTPDDGVVCVSVGTEGRYAVLRVVDEGAGIDPELLPRVFDLFVQAEDSSDRARGGLGIGLTLVRRLVELHGGTIEAQSDGKGRGATFTVRLTAIAGAHTRPSPPAKLRVRPRRVLLVDDNRDSREMYGLVLEADGHEVFQAGDGTDALKLFRREQPDVAIIDIGLPGMDGYEIARRFRAEPNGRAVTLIALTGYGQPEDRERSRAAGFDRHLVKPTSPEGLQAEMAS